MSSRVWSRPRTRVYNSNYDAGESYYKSALEGLDRKYGRSPAPTEPLATNGAGSFGSVRASLERERPTRRPILEDEDLDVPQRKLNTTALLDEFDSIFDRRPKNGLTNERTPARTTSTFDDDVDQEFAESMKRVKASRAARAAAEDMSEIESQLSSRKKESRSKLNFTSKMIDSVGVSEDVSSGRKKILSIVSAPNDSEELTRWTAVKPNRRIVLEDDTEDSTSQLAAAARARKSRARLDDLEAEMTALDERGAAREKRVRDLRTLLSENEASSKESLHSTVRIKSSIKTEKKQVAF